MSLLLPPSRFSRVQLCATPQTAAHQAPPHWDSPAKNTGVGCHFLLQCMKVESETEVSQSCPTSYGSHGLQPTRLLRLWDFPGKSTGVGCHCLLRTNFLAIYKSALMKGIDPISVGYGLAWGTEDKKWIIIL